MKRLSVSFRRIGVLVALFALLMLVPQPASAQLNVVCDDPAPANLALKVKSQPDAITPITGVETVTLEYTYTAPTHAKSITPIRVDISKSGEPSWANVVLAQTNDFLNIAEDGPTEVTRDISIDIDVGVDGPAFTRESVTISVEAIGGTCVSPADAATADVTIQPGFHEQWQVRFEQSIHRHGQNTNFQIPLRVDNLGNGMIEVRLREIGEDSGGPKLDVVVPGGFHQVGAEVQGRGEPTVTLPIDVQTPFRNGYMNERIPLALEISGRSADQQEIELTPAELQAQVQTQGVFVPGFGTVTAVLALLGIAVLQVQRRRN